LVTSDLLDWPQEFVHGIAAGDWLPCWNMHLQGTLFSFDFANEVEFQGSAVRDISIPDLCRGAFNEVALSSRMILLWQAACIRAGGWFGEGVPPATRIASVRDSERVVRQADREIRLEIGRRVLVPSAPSRIACLYLAEATASGRTMVSKMKGGDIYLMTVEITAALRRMRVDSRWLEGDPLEVDQIIGYWSGLPRYEAPAWEYLLDGAISCTNQDELARLKEWAVEAALRANGSQGPIGSPREPSRAVPFPSSR
jgi:hypothetical protein